MESTPQLHTTSGPIELRRPTAAAGYLVTGPSMVAVGTVAMALGDWNVFAWLGGVAALVGFIVTLHGVFYAVRALDTIAALKYDEHLRATRQP
ncbi:hypothetical protein MWU57_02450 [Isoptericola sp. S6320L]|uniref:hypothetical protein n=1 Tax=Isoptericola sp. S6320L TaxID=2926411 RepID=UPI001FF0E4EA|nr:hypothetical protein [Isoptericola sp. S6320L]MCK0115880.1 hypothetical protein [Isoptericola sp. S6320L]